MQGSVLFGIDNCDQVRRARQWLRAQSIEVRFHDFRRDGLEREVLERWLSRVPWDSLLNRRGTTWRRLTPEQRQHVVDQASAVEVMLAEPTLVKRPVLETGEFLLIGFSEPAWRAAFDAR